MDELVFSGKKKRKVLVDQDDDLLLTPKKARLSHATPAKLQTPLLIGTPARSSTTAKKLASTNGHDTLPEEHRQLMAIHTALEQAMSVALATAQISPDPDTGRVPAVLNHLSLQERGLGVRLGVEDLKKLCWIWEWDGETIPKSVSDPPRMSGSLDNKRGKKDGKKKNGAKVEEEDSDVEGEILTEDPEVNPFVTKTKGLEDEEDNPFVTNKEITVSKEWVRGGMGFCITSAAHTTRLDKSSPTKRVPAYGIGIEVDWSQEDVVGGRVGGMTAVARWTTASDRRKKEVRAKLESWTQLTSKSVTSSKPTSIPLADLPPLPKPPTTSKLVQMITSSTPRKLPFPSQFPTPLKSLVATPSSSHKGLLEDPLKDSEGFKIPFPVIPGDGPVTPHGPRPIGTPSSGSSTDAVTPSSGRSRGIRTPSFGKAAAKLAAAYTPTSDGRVTPTSGNRERESSVPSTPTNVVASSSVPNTVETPASARRAALYERIRAKSESEGESTKKTAVTASVRSTEKQSAKKVVKMVGPEELRRRCILGRLGTIAEAVWMLFSATGGSGSLVTTSSRKRRALEKGEVVRAVVKSSSVPISDAEAMESLTLLCELCPFFLRSKVIGGEEWLEMPASSGQPKAPIAAPGSPSRNLQSTTNGPPGSPPRRPTSAANLLGSPTRRQVIEDELLNRSPKRIKKEEGGLRQVRERIRRELEVDDEDEDDNPFI